jgi:hypothetical protein
VVERVWFAFSGFASKFCFTFQHERNVSWDFESGLPVEEYQSKTCLSLKTFELMTKDHAGEDPALSVTFLIFRAALVEQTPSARKRLQPTLKPLAYEAMAN